MSLSPIDRSHSTIYIFSYKNKTNFTLQSKVKIYKFYFTKKNFEIIFKKGKKNLYWAMFECINTYKTWSGELFSIKKFFLIYNVHSEKCT